MKIKNIVKTAQICLFIISLIILALSVRLSTLPAHTTLKYVDNEIVAHSWHDSYETILTIILLIQFVILFALIIADIVNKIKNKVKICGSVSFSVFLILFSYIMSGLSVGVMEDFWSDDDYNPQYYMFTDDIHTIVIEERSFLLYGDGTIYQIYDDNTAAVIGDISTDDGGRNYGRYDIKWFQDSAEITYNYFDLENSKQTEKVYFS